MQAELKKVQIENCEKAVKEIQDVLKKYNVDQIPEITISPRGIEPIIAVYSK